MSAVENIDQGLRGVGSGGWFGLQQEFGVSGKETHLLMQEM